jgi:hypothetical protein
MKRGTYARKMLELQRKHGGVTPAFLQERSHFVRPKHKKPRPLLSENVLAKLGRKLKQLWSRPLLAPRSRRRARHGRAR